MLVNKSVAMMYGLFRWEQIEHFKSYPESKGFILIASSRLYKLSYTTALRAAGL